MRAVRRPVLVRSRERRLKMDRFLLADWTTIAGTGSSSVTQPSTQWLDLPEYEDLVFFLEVKELTGTVTIAYETGVTCEDQLFTPVIPGFGMLAGTQVDRALFSTCTFPLCRFLRWKLTGSAGAGGFWDCTFRVWVAAYSFGSEDDVL
jgi:hypothetical protein